MRGGHPWIFSESIREQSREAASGELAIVFDRKDQFLALGFYDPDSPIRVRVIHRGRPETIDTDWWSKKVRTAAGLRATVFDAETTGGRWINGESDGFPGLVLDRYGGTCVLKIYSRIWLPRLDEIVAIITRELAPERLIFRSSRNIRESAEAAGLADGTALIGTIPAGLVEFLESGLRFEADVLKGQKTGFFLDQRENRRIIGSLSRGKEVLNAFSFSGGFSVYAARGGARSVTDVDISEHALASSRRNFALNSDATRKADHQLIQADVFDWLRERQTEKFGVVILDPPSLAKREADRAGALKAYANLAESGLGLTGRGGLLLCCSCSAHVRAEEFFEVARRTAARSGRKVEELRTTREPIDHHATFPEAEYLKAIYLRVD